MARSTTTRTEPDEPKLPSAHTLRRLKLSPEVAWYLVTRGIDLPKHPPLYKTPEGGADPEAEFHPEAVDKVLKSFSVLRHTQGELAGRPLNPDPWQIAYLIAPVYGWLKRNDRGHLVRVTTTCYAEMPRKNGKSTIAGGIGLYMTGADDEPGAQVVAAATTERQAGFVFGPVKTLVKHAPALVGRFKPLAKVILHAKSGSKFEVVSSAADAQHGANLHCAVIDELHIHKTPDLVDALETGTGSRAQPLVLFITTADEGKPNTIYARKRRYVEQLARGVFEDPTTYGVVFALPQNADPLDPRNWPKANPGYPISPRHEYLESKANAARNSPVELASFKRLHMGQRTRSGSTFITLDMWNANAGKQIRTRQVAGRVAYGGLDLGSVSDLTALCWLFPFGDRAGYDALWSFWAPEDSLQELNKRTADHAQLWVADGWLTLTPGNVTDYDFIREQIIQDMERFRVESIGFDNWNATQLATDLINDGAPLVETRQGFKTMSPALKEAQRLLLMGKREGAPRLHHGGNPVMKWMTDNLTVARDPAGNVKPDKANSGDKIDGWSALLNAVSEAVASDEGLSSYADDSANII